MATLESNRCLAIAISGYISILNKNNKKKSKREVWVKEYRKRHSHIPLIRELREDYPDDYKNYLRMDEKSFDLLLSLVKDKITKINTVMRQSITAEERLTATLRFLATGRSFQDLKFSSGISCPALTLVIPETCKAIYDALKEDYMKFPTSKQEWNEVAKGFEDKWQFINCGGALDGKHIRITRPPNSGATFYNYKNFYSIVLMALVNSNYEFIYVDVGKNGRLSDGGVIETTSFYHKLKANQLNLPENNETIKKLNFVFLGDEAFSLTDNFLKPFAQRELDVEKRIFNYRLSRARNVVENAFGIISSRFQILHRPLQLSHQNKCYVVLAICTLHNYLRRRNCYISGNSVDREDTTTGEIRRGDWHENAVDLVGLEHSYFRNPTIQAKQNRDNYKNYFNSAEGSVKWQNAMINSGRS